MGSVGFSIGLLSGGRARDRRPDRVAEVFPELEALLKVHIKSGQTG